MSAQPQTDLPTSIEKLFSLQAAGDAEGFSQMLAEDVVFDVPYAAADAPLPARGRETVTGMLVQGARAFFETIRLIPVEFYPMRDPNLLLVEYRSEGRVKSNGKVYANRYAGIFRFKDGKVVLWREYHNPEVWARAVA